MADILVVDDSKLMRDMVIACLRTRGGLSFSQAASGLEAIEALSIRPFDLVVLDLNMPDVNGIEVLEFVRSQDRMRALKIIVVTSRSDEISRGRAFAAGANEYLTKPFTPEQILGAVTRLLETDAPSSRPAPQAAGENRR